MPGRSPSEPYGIAPATPDGGGRIGAAVLVHGGWGHPEDWQWVSRLLADAGVEVATPDLPSHRPPYAGIAEDVVEVRRAVAGLQPPVVLVGWSYGGSLVTRTAAEEPSLAHLVYVSAIPERGLPGGITSALVAAFERNPHIDVRADGTCIVDNDWWLDEEAGTTFPDEVRDVLRRYPRRPSSVGILEFPPTTAAWEATPSTVLLGRHDTRIPTEAQEWATHLHADVRILDTDHFILFRRPEMIAGVVLEALAATAGGAAAERA